MKNVRRLLSLVAIVSFLFLFSSTCFSRTDFENAQIDQIVETVTAKASMNRIVIWATQLQKIESTGDLTIQYTPATQHVKGTIELPFSAYSEINQILETSTNITWVAHQTSTQIKLASQLVGTLFTIDSITVTNKVYVHFSGKGFINVGPY